MQGAVISTGNVAAAGGTFTQDIFPGSEDFLTVIADIGPTAAAAADIGVKVIPYLGYVASIDEGSEPNTVADAGLALVQSTNDPGVAAYLVGGHARVMVRVRVSGIEKLRIVVTNNNATTALPARIDWFYGSD